MSIDAQKSAQRMAVCPECGLDASSPPRIRWARALRRYVPLGVALAALGCFVVRAALKSEPFVYNQPYWGPRFVEPAFVFEDLLRKTTEEVHSPHNSGGGSLVQAIHTAVQPDAAVGVGKRMLAVGFLPRQGARREMRAFGWPVEWWTRTSISTYEDPVRREGFVAAATDPNAEYLPVLGEPSDPLRVSRRDRWQWGWSCLFFQPAPEECGGRFVSWKLDPCALATLPLAAILAWLGLPIACRTWNRATRRCDTAPKRRTRLLAAGGGLLFVLATSALLGQHHVSPPLASTAIRTQVAQTDDLLYWDYPGMHRVNIRLDEFERLLRDPLGDRVLATAILEALPPTVGKQGVLAVCVMHEDLLHTKVIATCSQPWGLFSVEERSWIRRADFGSPEPMSPPRGTDAWCTRESAGVSWLRGESATKQLSVSVGLGPLCAVGVGLWMIWQLAKAPFLFVGEGRIRRRWSRGLCTACGYELGPPPGPYDRG